MIPGEEPKRISEALAVKVAIEIELLKELSKETNNPKFQAEIEQREQLLSELREYIDRENKKEDDFPLGLTGI